MNKLILLVLLFLPPSCFAQQAIQKATCGRDTSGVGSCSFSQPITAGDLLVAVVEGGCPTMDCNPIAGDSLGQTWATALVIAQNTRPNLYYVLNSAPGNETLYFLPLYGSAWSVVLLEYPPALSLDAANANFRGSAADQESTTSANFLNEDWAWALPVKMFDATKELVIGYSLSGSFGMSASPGEGFSLESNIAGHLVVEDELETKPGLCFASLQWNDQNWWIMGAVAFKMK